MPDTLSSSLDDLGRPAISSGLKSSIDHAFDGLQARSALIVIAHEDGVTRGTWAANFGDSGWKVAGGMGFVWHEQKPMGYIAIEKTW